MRRSFGPSPCRRLGGDRGVAVRKRSERPPTPPSPLRAPATAWRAGSRARRRPSRSSTPRRRLPARGSGLRRPSSLATRGRVGSHLQLAIAAHRLVLGGTINYADSVVSAIAQKCEGLAPSPGGPSTSALVIRRAEAWLSGLRADAQSSRRRLQGE